MVEEQFKLGLVLDIDQASIDKIAKQISQGIEQSLTKSSRNIKLPQTAAPASTKAAAAAKSLSQTLEISASNLAKEIRKALAAEIAGIKKNNQPLVNALEDLKNTLARFSTQRAERVNPPQEPAGSRQLTRLEKATSRLETSFKNQAKNVVRAESQVGRAKTPQEVNQAEQNLAKEERRLETILEGLRKVRRQEISESRRLAESQRNLASAMDEEAAAHRERAAKIRKAPVQNVTVQRQGTKGKVIEPASVAQEQIGGPNIRRGANIDATRAGGSQRTAGAGAGTPGSKASILSDAPRVRDARQGTVEDRPQYHRDQQKSLAARETREGVQRGAEARVSNVNTLLAALRKSISNISGFQHMDIGNIFRRINLPERAEVGTGAAPVIKDLAGNIKIVQGSIELFGSKVENLSTVISDRIKDFIRAGGHLEEIERMARRNPERAIASLRKSLRGIFAAPGGKREEINEEYLGQPRKGYQKGGEFMLRYKPTEEEQKRLSGLQNEAEVLGELNKIIYTHIANNKKLAQALKRVGVEALTSVGLSEKTAADIKIERDEESKKITRVTMPVQTRPLHEVGVGGGGAVRHAREFLISEISSIVGGIEPTVKGKLEKELLDTGVMVKQGFKEFLTAIVDPDIVPEVRNDQFLFDPKVVNMAMEELKSTTVKTLSANIKPGAKVTPQTIVGSRGAEANLEQVKAPITALEGTVEEIQEVFIDGIRGFKVIFKQINEMGTGAKLIERGGIKGIALSANLEKQGYPKGTGVVMSMEGLVKRHGLRTIVEMMSNAISDATGKGAQEIADQIVTAMEKGATILKAVKETATKAGAPEFTGTIPVKGALGKAAGGNLEVLAGKMAWGRAPREGTTGPIKIKERFFNAADITALRSRASTARFAEQFESELKKSSNAHHDLTESLRSLSGQAEETTMSLRRVRPGEVKALPGVGAAPADLKGTLLDPDLGEAFAMMLPKRGGGERAFRVPGLGKELGQRATYTTGVGTIGPNPLAVQLDRIREQAVAVAGSLGKIDFEPGSDSMKEASEIVAAKLKQVTALILSMGTAVKRDGKTFIEFSGESEKAAQIFVKSMMPAIQAMGRGPAGISFINRKGQRQEIKRSAENYVKFLDEKMQKVRPMQGQILAIQDLMAERGKGTESKNITGVGKVFTDVEVLNKALKILDIRLEGSSKAAEDAYARLDMLEKEYAEMLVKMASSRNKPVEQGRRSIAASKQAGVSFAPMGTTLQFRTDISKELNSVGKMLKDLSTQGYDTAEAMGAFGRIKEAQKTKLPKIERDTVLINKKDFNRLAKLFSERLGITQTEAQSRLLRTGLAQRYPVTGEQSFMPAKLRPVEKEVLPEGRLGVAGTMAVSSTEDLKKMLAPLEQMEKTLIQTAEDNGYQGEAARKAGEELRKLSPILDRLRMQFVANALNLDFDGDKIAFHADMAKDASGDLKTFSDTLLDTGVDFRKSLTQVLSAEQGPGGPGTSLEDVERLFRMGKAKGRPAELQKGVLWPAGPEKARFESVAHTAPKKSVGLMTDAFNEMLLATQAGTKKMSNAMATGMGQIMLGMNEALAQKHGGTLKGGPQEFLRLLKRGDLNKIYEAMDAGEGFMGKLAKQAEKVQANVKRDLQRVAALKGAAGIEEIIKKEGLGIKVDPNDINKAIGEILQKTNLKSVIKNIFETIKENMVDALMAGGKTLQEAQGEVGNMLTPNEKGYVGGLDLTRIIGTNYPGYAMTRAKGHEAFGQQPLEERIQRLVKLQGGPEGTHGVELSEIEDLGQAAESAKSGLIEFFKALKESGSVIGMTDEAMRKRFGTVAGGVFQRGTTTEHGGEGKIYFRRQYLDQIKDVSKVLSDVTSGNIDPGRLKEVRNSLDAFFGVLEHESVHKASKEWANAVDTIEQELAQGTGVLGQYANKIFQGRQKTSTVFRSQLEELKRLTALPAGTEVEGMARVQHPETGKYAYVKKQMPVEQAIEEQKSRMRRSTAEELMAYTVEPDKFQKSWGNLPKEAQDFLKQQVENLRRESGQSGDILRLVHDAREQIVCKLFDSILQATESMGPPDVRPEIEGITNAASTDFPAAADVNKALTTLGKHEEAIIQSAGLHKAVSTIGRGPTGILERKEAEPTGLKLGKMPELETIARRIKGLNKAVIEAVPSADQLDTLQKEIKRAARAARARINAMAKDPAMKEAMGGVSGQDEYMNVLREFQRNVATTFTQRARFLQRQIQEMRQAGKEQTPEFSNLTRELVNTVKRLHAWASESLAVSGGGRGTTASYLTSVKGEMLPAAREAGVTPTASSFTTVLKDVAGTGAEATKFLERMQRPILESVIDLKKGEQPIQIWNRLFSELAAYPEDFKVNLAKVIEIMAKFSRMLGISHGQFSELSQGMQEVVKSAREIGKSVQNLNISSVEDIMAAVGGAGKRPRLAGAQAMGAEFENSINEQYANIEKLVKERQDKLNKLIQSKGFKATGAKAKHFESMEFQIVDPHSGQVLDKYRANFKRTSKGIVSGLENIRDASHSVMKSTGQALRRVVQWGFASGVVYGAMRAFRAFVDVVRNVETRITDLKKVMNTSITNFKQIQDAATDMGVSFGISVDQVLEGMTVYAQQGLKVDKVLERTKATLMAVNVTTLTSAEATEALTAVMKLFGNELDDSQHAVDAWASVAAKHAITAKELALAVQRSGAAAKTAGVSFEDFLGITTAIGAVTRQSGKEIATGTKFIFRAMRQPKATKELVGLGIKTQTPTGQMRGTMDVLKDLAGMWGKLSKAQQLSIAQSMAGVRHYNQFIVLMENFSEVLSASADATDSQGFAARKNAIAIQTFSKQMQSLAEEVKKVALDAGQALLPVFKMVVGVTKNVLGVLNSVPDSLKAIGISAAGMGLILHRGLDFFLDTMMAISGEDGIGGTIRKQLKSGGILRGVKTLGSKIFKGLTSTFKRERMANILTSVFSTIKNPLSLFKGIKQAMRMPAGMSQVLDISSWGAAARAVYKVREAFSALSVAGKALAVGGIGIVITALAALTYAMRTHEKTGKEVEDEMFDQIGVMEDQVDTLNQQKRGIDSASLAWKKYQTSLSKNTTIKGVTESLQMGDFKGPRTALKEYQDTIAETSMSMAQFGRVGLKGIDESGKYSYEASAGMESLASSALDAKKATVAALRTEVVEAYVNELSKAQNGWQKLIEFIGGHNEDMLTQLKDARETVDELAKVFQDETSKGILTSVGAQNVLNDAVKEEIKLRGEVALVAKNLKKNLEEMPTFQNKELAREMIGSKPIGKAAQVAAQTGVYGQGATGTSVQMHLFAKNLGLGGLVGGAGTAKPGLLMEQLLSKGLTTGVKGKQVQGNAIGFIGQDLAKELISRFTEGVKEGGDLDAAAKQAQVIFTRLDETTGELIYNFGDSLNGIVGEVRQSQLGDKLGKAMGEQLFITQQQIEAQAQENEKLFTLQGTGALAGVRIPKGGMPNLGPGTFRELTPEQRVLGALPKEMQRLSEVQSQLSEITKRYNEDLQGSVSGNEEASAALQENTRLADIRKKMLFSNLKSEEFALSKLGLMQMAIAKLGKTLDDAAKAARDAQIEEDTRNQLLKETSGALKGQPIAPQLQFGKTMQELSGQERLQLELGPGFAKTLSRVAGLENQYQTGVQNVAEIRKQTADFDEMITDLKTAEGKLNIGLKRSITQATTGANPGEQMIAEAVAKSAQDLISEDTKQTSLLSKILDVMKVQTDLSTEQLSKPEAASKLKDILGGTRPGHLIKGLGALGETGVQAFNRDVLGLRPRKEESYSRTEKLNRYFGNPVTTLEAKGNGLEFVSDQQKKEFDTALKKYIDALAEFGSAQKIIAKEMKLTGATAKGMNLNKLPLYRDARDKVQHALQNIVSIGPVKEATAKFIQAKTSSPEAKKQVEIKQQQVEKNKYLGELEAKRLEAIQKLGLAEKQAVAKTQEAARILSSKESFRLAIATQDFANAIEAQINGFKKAQMLAYTKVGSAIEGPMARVGQPGFRTQFENQQMEIQNKFANRPFSLQEYQQREQDLNKVGFDKKEALLKEQQDKEVATLRQQQSQAESIRETIASALVGGQLKGTGFEKTAKDFMDTLTQELVTSEQVKTTGAGGELQFKGVPALEDASRFLSKIQESAKEQARRAEKQFQQEINQPMVDELAKQTGYNQQTAQNTSESTQLLRQLTEQKTGMAGPMPSGTGNYIKSAAEAAAAGTTPVYQKAAKVGEELNPQKLFSFNSKKVIPDYAKYAPGSLNLTDYLSSMRDNAPQVGAANTNRDNERKLRQKFGLNDATFSGIITNTKGAGLEGTAVGDAATKANKKTGLEDQNDILQAIRDAVESSQETLAAISNAGLTVPDSLGNQIEAVGTTIVDALSDTLSVEIENEPTVTVDGLEDAFSSALDSSGLSGIGADVTDALGRLALLETVVDPDGLPVEDLIAEAKTELEAEIVINTDNITTQDTRLSGLETTISSLPDFTTLSDTVDTLAENFDSTTSDFEERITSLESEVSSLSDTSTALVDSLAALAQKVQSNKQLGDTALRAQVDRIDSNETQLKSLDNTLKSLQGKSESAISFAQQALNRANQKV